MVLTARVPPSTKLGEPIPLTVVLRNERDELIGLESTDRDDPFDMEVFEASGKRVPWRHDLDMDRWSVHTIFVRYVGPGQALPDEYNLSDRFMLDRPCEYTLCVRGYTNEFADDEEFLVLSVEGLKFSIRE